MEHQDVPECPSLSTCFMGDRFKWGSEECWDSDARKKSSFKRGSSFFASTVKCISRQCPKFTWEREREMVMDIEQQPASVDEDVHINVRLSAALELLSQFSFWNCNLLYKPAVLFFSADEGQTLVDVSQLTCPKNNPVAGVCSVGTNHPMDRSECSSSDQIYLVWNQQLGCQTSSTCMCVLWYENILPEIETGRAQTCQSRRSMFQFIG